jgi:predicted RNA-binding protein YlxR (DUF448 family)
MHAKDLTRPLSVSRASRREDAGPQNMSERSRLRTCVGCGVEENPEAFVRLVVGPDGELAVDAKGGAFGRGAHVHARPGCLVKAAKGGLQRSFKGKVKQVDGAELAAMIAEAMDRRVEGLIVSALRAGRIAIGGDAVKGSIYRKEAKVLVVACDAAAAANTDEVRNAVSEGRAVAWSTKDKLGALVRKGDEKPVAVLAIEDDRIGGALSSAVQAALSCRSFDSKKTTDHAAAAASNGERGA